MLNSDGKRVFVTLEPDRYNSIGVNPRDLRGQAHDIAFVQSLFRQHALPSAPITERTGMRC